MMLLMPPHLARLAVACLCAGLPGWVLAEKADRSLPMVVESDGRQAASVDLARKITTVSGHVVITQGTLLIKADRVEIRETAAGKYLALARAPANGLAEFRQKRDRVDEYIEAQAETVDYDGATERVKFIGQARLRVLRNGIVSDEASAATITYDQRADTIVFDGGSAPSGSGAAPGRARLVFVPRGEGGASAPAGSGAPR